VQLDEGPAKLRLTAREPKAILLERGATRAALPQLGQAVARFGTMLRKLRAVL
jgi:hypothetical protein